MIESSDVEPCAWGKKVIGQTENTFRQQQPSLDVTTDSAKSEQPTFTDGMFRIDNQGVVARQPESF